MMVVAAGWMAAASADQEQSPDGDLLWLKSGERIGGNLISLDPIKGLGWRHSDIKENLAFSAGSFRKVRLHSAGTPLPVSSSNACFIRLTNADELDGELENMDSTNVVINTWYAGRLVIPRSRIDYLQPIVSHPRVIFEGPTGMEDWTLGNAANANVNPNAWAYSDGCLVANSAGSIARDFKLPPLCSIEFDLAWSDYVSIALALYADSLQPINLMEKDQAPDFAGFYSLLVSDTYFDLRSISKGKPLTSLGMVIQPLLAQMKTARLLVRVNKPERIVCLYINGALVKEWRDAEQTLGAGTCLRFVNNNPGPTVLKLSKLTVSQWDGRPEIQTNQVDNPNNDVIKLLPPEATGNASPLPFVVRSIAPEEKTALQIRNGQLILASGENTTTIPMSQVSSIAFSKARTESVGSTATDVKAYFVKRGQMTLKAEGLADGKFLASSPIFGKVSISVNALRTLEWKN